MKARLLALLTRMFGRPEELKSAQHCPAYLYRWVVAKLRHRWWGRLRDANIYLHRIVTDDWSRDLHDHPKRFVSIGLWGGYVEETTGGAERTFRAPWVRTFPAEHVHRLRLLGPGRECWTLVITLRTEREWGFYPGGRFVQWQEYIRGRAAGANVSCE